MKNEALKEKKKRKERMRNEGNEIIKGKKKK